MIVENDCGKMIVDRKSLKKKHKMNAHFSVKELYSRKGFITFLQKLNATAALVGYLL